MPNFLNLTLPIKQDDQSQAEIRSFASQFGDTAQPITNQIMRQSRDVHHARAVVIEYQGKVLFLQVITEYDSDFKIYTKWFAAKLPDFFAALFHFVPDGLTLDEIKDPDKLDDKYHNVKKALRNGKKFTVRRQGTDDKGDLKEELLKAEWSISTTNRRVRIYKLTAMGAKHLEREVSSFETMLEGITRVLAPVKS